MKNLKYIIGALIALQFASVSCEEDHFEEGTEAKILYSFSVTGTSGTLFRGVIDDEAGTVTLKINPYLDAAVELDSVKATFYLSKGATVTPDPSEPQNFAQEGGVSYTVTSQDGKTTKTYVVSWGVSDKLADGEGFSYAEVGAAKTFPELGYPGEKGNFNFSDSKQYGDLWMYHAYCGDELVLYSRRYALEAPDAGYTSMVLNKTTLEPTGTTWNLGSISIANLAMIVSDYHGHLVAAVENDANNAVEFFYWKKASDAPTSMGTVNGVSLPGFSTSAIDDASANMQVVGDVTTSAWITALAPHSTEGNHYRIKVSGGKVESNYTTISTGYSSSDCGWFQMICPLDDSDAPQYAISDAQGTANVANSVHCYINSYSGLTLYTMPSFWQNILQTWWVGTGTALSRAGGRIPISALPINGKTYVIVNSGTAWWYCSAVVSSDLQSLAHQNLNIAYSVNRPWGFGTWVDWYYDEEAKEAYLAVWYGRYGMFTYKMTCYE